MQPSLRNMHLDNMVDFKRKDRPAATRISIKGSEALVVITMLDGSAMRRLTQLLLAAFAETPEKKTSD